MCFAGEALEKNENSRYKPGEAQEKRRTRGGSSEAKTKPRIDERWQWNQRMCAEGQILTPR